MARVFAGLLLLAGLAPTARAEAVWPVETAREVFDFCVTPELGLEDRDNILRNAGWVPFEPVAPHERGNGPWDARDPADLAILGIVVSFPYLGFDHDEKMFREAFEAHVMTSGSMKSWTFRSDARTYLRDGRLLSLGPMTRSNRKANGRWRVQCLFIAPADADSTELRVLPGKLIDTPGTRFLLDMREVEGFKGLADEFIGSVIIAKGKMLSRFMESDLPDIVTFKTNLIFAE
ncbi:hypothetical protein [Marimonas lutisalis]|uniref:hypothetical protein n=1 Tax=Marimonas lutisalis TaxID=2545756 RepID=UPI0010F8EEC5|nr:hypothetical protein [Marimonas lutisalis]